MSDEFAPVTDWYVPTPHAAHSVIPDTGWYDPTPHREHTYAPGTDVYLPVPHARHWLEFVAPLMGWYVPASQFTHAPLSM
jgi:hypothetical protein